MNPILTLLSGLFQPIADAYKAKQDRQAAKESAIIKVQQTQLEDAHKVELTDAEWEALAIAHQDNTWKDEYVTLIITAPIAGILLGGVWCAVTGSTAILDGFNLGIENLTKAGIDMGQMMTAVVFAAIGLKFWRK